jgi:signal transduction histidine kinase
LSRPSSTILFGLVLAFALSLVAWWTLFQSREAHALERASEHLAAGEVDAAARALGATDARTLPELARRRSRMFESEGLAFGVVLMLGGALFFIALRREARLQVNHERFLTGATHELKTPLATIRLLLESLRDGSVPAEKRERYLISGLLEVERLERGLINLLTAAGLRTTHRPLLREAGDLAGDVRLAVAALENRAEAAGIRLRAEELGSVQIRRDPEALQIVLRNLLDNAIQYSSNGGVVDVSVQREDGAAAVAVTDHGRGIPADELAQVFQPFFRGSNQSRGGAGLGLFLVRTLVREHRGTVQAWSEGPGRGARFTVRLPVDGGGR